MQKKDNNLDADIYAGVIKWICVGIMFIQKAKKEAYIDGLVQDCSSSSALAMELLQFGTKSSISTCYNLRKLTIIRHCVMSLPDTQNMKYLLDLPEVRFNNEPKSLWSTTQNIYLCTLLDSFIVKVCV